MASRHWCQCERRQRFRCGGVRVGFTERRILNGASVSYRKAFSCNILPHRDGGIRTRDPLNPIRLRGKPNYSMLSAFRGKPGVGAGVSRHGNRSLAGETVPETAPLIASHSGQQNWNAQLAANSRIRPAPELFFRRIGSTNKYRSNPTLRTIGRRSRIRRTRAGLGSRIPSGLIR